MAASVSLPSDSALLPLVSVAAKRASVEDLIESYATGHAAMDVGIGLAGFLPIPGAAIAATIAAIAAQAPAVYQPMAGKIAEIYHRDLSQTARGEVVRGAIGGGIRDAAVFFGVEFFEEIAGELLREIGVGLGVSAIPVLGGFVGMYLDVKIAWTMTWRVGLMIALWHENGGKWIIDRKHTYDIAARFIKVDKDRGQPRPRVADFVTSVPEVQERQEQTVAMMAQFLISAGITKEDVRNKLLERGIASDLIDRTLDRL